MSSHLFHRIRGRQWTSTSRRAPSSLQQRLRRSSRPSITIFRHRSHHRARQQRLRPHRACSHSHGRTMDLRHLSHSSPPHPLPPHLHVVTVVDDPNPPRKSQKDFERCTEKAQISHDPHQMFYSHVIPGNIPPGGPGLSQCEGVG